ncbi:MAG: FAD-dependent oxidoreductase, partial [Paracoccaceae bacterium]|nr:FAD-dependent oxidoreductase [Paracoccaceae bacterium]
MGFSGWRVIKEGLTGNRGWKPQWRDAAPKKDYDVLIIGGGGHGLATAYYLAKEHGITNVAVLEKGHLGSGNIGRNTTLVRSNYMMPGNSEFYSHSLKLWEGLSQELNYNVMHSPRGQIVLNHSDAQRDGAVRRGNAMINRGDEAELLTRDDVRRMVPYLNFDSARFPIYGGLLQRRAGTARHDAVAWGYAAQASRRGVEIHQRTEVESINVNGGRVQSVTTNRGEIACGQVMIACGGVNYEVAMKAGVRL